MKELVSVVVPCYNQAQYLSEALASVLEQTYDEWECIIVNDGSPDNTETIAKDWCKKDNRFKYFYKENGGLSSARNYGINNSIGAYILTLDSDDKFEKTFLTKAVAILDSNENVGIVSCWGYRFVGNAILNLFKPKGKSLDDFLFNNAAIGNSLFRKKCWIEVGGFDETMKKGYEDWEFYIRVSRNGWQTVIIEEPLFFYRQHKTSMRIDALQNYDKEIRLYIFKKHKEVYQLNYEKMVAFFLETIELHRKNELKRISSIDYRLGHFILKPLRFFKQLIKK